MGPNLPLSVAPGPHHLWETLAGSGAGRTGGEGGMMVTMVIREAGPEAGVRVTVIIMHRKGQSFSCVI